MKNDTKILDKKITADEVAKSIKKAAGNLLVEQKIFLYYQKHLFEDLFWPGFFILLLWLYRENM